MNSEIKFQSLPELSLYVHLPWCVKKCPYCDFNSHEAGPSFPEEAYLNALSLDLQQSLPLIWGRPVTSIFIGGGTPSLFSAAGIDRLLSDLRAHLPLMPTAEITLEANPGSFEVERFAAYAASGINRLSLGVQSFDDAALARLGRVHDGQQALKAVDQALRLFPRVNLDLMYGLPGQSLGLMEKDLDQALALSPTHLSVYQLTIEPNTRFAVSPPKPGLPDDEAIWAMQSLLLQKTADAGLSRYEVSAYARPGAESQHNLNYWTFGDYLGIGAGAHGKLSFANQIIRTNKPRLPQAYMDEVTAIGSGPIDEAAGQAGQQRQVPIDGLAFEFMLNALRLVHGVPVSRWQQTTGLSVAAHPTLLDRLGDLQARGLMETSPGVFKTTPKGFDFLNDVQQAFL